MTNTDNPTAVYGGWGKTPLGFIEGDATMEISYTDAMFYQDMFTVSSAGTTVSRDAQTSVRGGGIYIVETGPKIEIPFQVNLTNIQIAGYEVAGTGTAAAGKPVAAYDSTSKKTTITFAADDAVVGEDMLVTYERAVAKADVTTITTIGGAARGSLTMTWAVMSAGDDCSQAAIKGYLHLKVPRVMVTTRASLDTSRSTAATPNIVFSAIDAHRGDNKWYDLIYEPLTDGAISTEYTGNITWDA